MAVMVYEHDRLLYFLVIGSESCSGKSFYYLDRFENDVLRYKIRIMYHLFNHLCSLVTAFFDVYRNAR